MFRFFNQFFQRFFCIIIIPIYRMCRNQYAAITKFVACY
jgi:hypothetical protein